MRGFNQDTIVAITTPPGRGGVGIVRLSGQKSYSIALTLTQHASLKPRQLCYGKIYNQQNEVVDEAVTLFFKAPYSFTGEDVIEFQCHGSPILLDQVIHLCLEQGARLAKPGEFSERAFLNDKIDLTQAEAIADLINASSVTAVKMAQRSLQGEFSTLIQALNEQIINLRIYVEAAIDFPEEEIDFLADGKIASLLVTIISQLEKIQKQANQGALLREGLTVVIAGPPNAGKSTLINTLTGREIAIVTDIAGTTRDVMREQILLDDLPIHILDTAGLRDSEDIVEQEGIKRAWQEVQKADCILLVSEVQEENKQALSDIENKLPKDIPLIRILNKIDQLPSVKTQTDYILLSARTGEGVQTLKAKIKEVIGYQPSEGLFLARRRHLQSLGDAHDFLLHGQTELNLRKAGELLAEDLRLAHQSLTEITGEFSSDDLLGKIFSSFCIGK